MVHALNALVAIGGSVIATILWYLWMADEGIVEKTEFYYWFVDILNQIIT